MLGDGEVGRAAHVAVVVPAAGQGSRVEGERGGQDKQAGGHDKGELGGDWRGVEGADLRNSMSFGELKSTLGSLSLH